MHHVHGTAANVANVMQVAELAHGEEDAVYADAGYTGGRGHLVCWSSRMQMCGQVECHQEQ